MSESQDRAGHTPLNNSGALLNLENPAMATITALAGPAVEALNHTSTVHEKGYTARTESRNKALSSNSLHAHDSRARVEEARYENKSQVAKSSGFYNNLTQNSNIAKMFNSPAPYSNPDID